MRDSPRSPTVKTNGSRFEGNRIINPHSPDSKVNKQTNKHCAVQAHERGDCESSEETEEQALAELELCFLS